MKEFTNQELGQMFQVYHQGSYIDENNKEMAVYEYEDNYIAILLEEEKGILVANFEFAQDAIEYIQNNI
jgi:hypothetical protein